MLLRDEFFAGERPETTCSHEGFQNMNNSSTQFTRLRLVVTLVVLTLGLTMLFAVLGLDLLVAITFEVGIFILVPLVALLGDALPMVASGRRAEDAGERAARDDATDPVERLRSCYASGELTDEEFERRLERLLETEDVELTGTAEQGRDDRRPLSR